MTAFINESMVTHMTDFWNTNKHGGNFTPVNAYYPIPTLAVGETWYVKLTGATSIITVVITDLTPNTVELKTLGEVYSRHIRGEVTFVEKVYQ